MIYDFEWDLVKAQRNRQKHAVGFETAASVFHDPAALSMYDDGHSTDEDRWITLGISSNGTMLVVHHTFEEIDGRRTKIRIFSCRKATARERRQYLESNR